MSSVPEFDEEQLAAARTKAWHQDGSPLLTAEAARAWLGNFGLVLFAPRTLQLPSPAPSLVEATLGAANSAPDITESKPALELLGRLVADGAVLPLNLMGVVSDTPDFVVSAQVFSYIFTMRGDKAWKQAPSTSGSVKVSPLGLRAFEVLTEHRSLTAAQLASEMGREVTEAATLRVLTELWSQLRVIPLHQPGDAPALWELTTRRFTKAIKAGANAGQPTALSALISLYLAQVIAATEEEITTFLSPLTARSRLREVLHALAGSRQLETIAIEGKTLLHVPGALTQFMSAFAQAPADGSEAVAVIAPKKIGTGRIQSYSGDGATSGELRGKPARSFASGTRPGRAGAKTPARFPSRSDGKTDRERRPFRKTVSSAKPSFTKPWSEGKKPSPARPTTSARPDSFTKFRRSAPEDREPLGPREQAGLPPERRSYPKAGFDRGSKPGGFPKRPFVPRAGKTAERSSFKPASSDRGERPREFGAKRTYSPRENRGEERGPFKPSRPANGARPGTFKAKGSFTPRTAEQGERTLPKKPYKPRAADADKRLFTKAPWVPKAQEFSGRSTTQPFRPRKTTAGYESSGTSPRKNYAAKSGGKFGAKPGAKSGSSKPGAFRSGARTFGSNTGSKPAFRGFGGKARGSAAGGRPTFRKKPEVEG